MFHYVRVSKNFLLQRVKSRFSIFCRKFIVSQCRKNSQLSPSLLCSRKFPVAKKLWIRGEGGHQDFPLKFFASQSHIFRRGILYCCSIFGYRKSLDKNWGEYQHIPSEMFCLAVPKVFVGESFTVAVFLGTGKVWIRRVEYQHFPSEVFCLTVPKNFVGQLFSVAVISGTGKV